MINKLNIPSEEFLNKYIIYIASKKSEDVFKELFEYLLSILDLSLEVYILKYKDSYQKFNVNNSENIDYWQGVYYTMLVVAMPPNIINNFVKTICDKIRIEKNSTEVQIYTEIFIEVKNKMQTIDNNFNKKFNNSFRIEILKNKEKLRKYLIENANKGSNISQLVEQVDSIDFDGVENKLHSYDFIEVYKNFRNAPLAHEFIRELDVFMCPYCNLNDFSIKDGEGDEFNSTFQLDHFYDKDTYPFFAVSIFNLVPCCAKCNSNKRNIQLINNPYLEDIKVKFSISNNNEIAIGTTTSNLLDIKDLNIEEYYNAEFSIIKKEIVELKELGTKYNNTYFSLFEKMKLTEDDTNIKREIRFWQKNALRDGIIEENDFGKKRVSNAKRDILKIALGVKFDELL